MSNNTTPTVATTEWRDPSVREENKTVNLRHLQVFYMATKYGTVLDTDASRKYLEKRYSEKLSVTLWRCNRGGYREVIRRGNAHF